VISWELGRPGFALVRPTALRVTEVPVPHAKGIIRKKRATERFT